MASQAASRRLNGGSHRPGTTVDILARTVKSRSRSPCRPDTLLGQLLGSGNDPCPGLTPAHRSARLQPVPSAAHDQANASTTL
jgi:hypothetical protein